MLMRHGDEMRVIDLRVVAEFDPQHLVLRLGGAEQPRRGLQSIARGQHQREALETARDAAPVGELRSHRECAPPERYRPVGIALPPEQVAQRRQRVYGGIA